MVHIYISISFPCSNSHHQTDLKAHSVLVNTPKVAGDVSMKTCTASLFYAGLFYGSPPAFWMHSPTRVTVLKFSLNTCRSRSLFLSPYHLHSHTLERKWNLSSAEKNNGVYVHPSVLSRAPSLAMLRHAFLHQCRFCTKLQR